MDWRSVGAMEEERRVPARACGTEDGGGAAGKHDSYGSCNLCICRLFFGLSTFFVASLLFMKGISYCVIKRKLELLDCVEANLKRS